MVDIDKLKAGDMVLHRDGIAYMVVKDPCSGALFALNLILIANPHEWATFYPANYNFDAPPAPVPDIDID